jgi:hypothetical protein
VHHGAFPDFVSPKEAHIQGQHHPMNDPIPMIDGFYLG